MGSNPLEAPRAFLDSLLGKTVTIQLADGNMLSGVLVSRDPEDNSLLIRRMADEEPILITWHAVAMLYRMPEGVTEPRTWAARGSGEEIR
jgi:hypothetical protein